MDLKIDHKLGITFCFTFNRIVSKIYSTDSETFKQQYGDLIISIPNNKDFIIFSLLSLTKREEIFIDVIKEYKENIKLFECHISEIASIKTDHYIEDLLNVQKTSIQVDYKEKTYLTREDLL